MTGCRLRFQSARVVVALWGVWQKIQRCPTSGALIVPGPVAERLWAVLARAASTEGTAIRLAPNRLMATRNLPIAATCQELKYLYSLVVSIGNVNSVVFINENAAGQPELSQADPPFAECEEVATSPVENLDGVEEGIDHVHMPLAV